MLDPDVRLNRSTRKRHRPPMAVRTNVLPAGPGVLTLALVAVDILLLFAILAFLGLWWWRTHG
jgi:hypothetical protein